MNIQMPLNPNICNGCEKRPVCAEIAQGLVRAEQVALREDALVSVGTMRCLGENAITGECQVELYMPTIAQESDSAQILAEYWQEKFQKFTQGEIATV